MPVKSARTLQNASSGRQVIALKVGSYISRVGSRVFLKFKNHDDEWSNKSNPMRGGRDFHAREER